MSVSLLRPLSVEFYRKLSQNVFFVMRQQTYRF